MCGDHSNRGERACPRWAAQQPLCLRAGFTWPSASGLPGPLRAPTRASPLATRALFSTRRCVMTPLTVASGLARVGLRSSPLLVCRFHLAQRIRPSGAASRPNAGKPARHKSVVQYSAMSGGHPNRGERACPRWAAQQPSACRLHLTQRIRPSGAASRLNAGKPARHKGVVQYSAMYGDHSNRGERACPRWAAQQPLCLRARSAGPAHSAFRGRFAPQRGQARSPQRRCSVFSDL